MKKFIITLFLSFHIFTYGQVKLTIDKITDKAVYTEVISIDSTNVENLYNRAKFFVANSYKSSKTVTDLSDDKLHSIIIKAYMTAHFKSWGNIFEAGGFNYTLKIYCKDNRYKYEITDLTHTGMYDTKNNHSGGGIENEKPICGTFFITKGQWEYMKQDCVSNIETLIVYLKRAMINKSEIEKKDW